MGKSKFTIREHYAAKYRGANGDLIVGVVKSVRMSGHVHLTNLLSGSDVFKTADVLAVRNKRISKAQAKKLVTLWEKTKDTAQVREAAVNTPAFVPLKERKEKAAQGKAKVVKLRKKMCKKSTAKRITQDKAENPNLVQDLETHDGSMRNEPALRVASFPELERIAVALEQIAEYMGNMKIG